MNRCLVIGATGVVGGYIVDHLSRAGCSAVGMARSAPSGPQWVTGSIDCIDEVADRLPNCSTVFATISIPMLAGAVPTLAAKGATRIVALSTTSILTKLETGAAEERKALQMLVDGERDFIAECVRQNVEWTILRPTLIYAEGKDVNVTRLANIIRRLGFFPLSGQGLGLRQPVHAEDLAIGAIAAASSPSAANKTYIVPGGETLTYREMVGRIFDGLNKPRLIVSIPAPIWRAAFGLASRFFPGANAAMGERMNKDMVFEKASAEQDFNWHPRSFRPQF